MKVTNVLTRNPEVIRPDANICEASRKMKKNDIGMLPVCENQRLVGVITDRDVTIRGVADHLDLSATSVREVMTPGAYYCFEDQELDEAAAIMKKQQVRRLPVLNENKRLIGVISLGDIAVRSQNERMAEEILERVSEAA